MTLVKLKKNKPSNEVANLIAYCSEYMPEGAIELPFRFQGKLGYASARLCWLPCTFLIILLLYAIVAFSTVGSIREIRTYETPFLNNSEIEQMGKYGTIYPGFVSNGRSEKGKLRRWSKGPFVRIKSHEEREKDFCDEYAGDD